MRRIELLSESPSIRTSSIIVDYFTFPLPFANQQAKRFSSFIFLFLPQSLGKKVPCKSTPDSPVTGTRRLTAALIKLQKLNYRYLFFLFRPFYAVDRYCGWLFLFSRPPSKPLHPQNSKTCSILYITYQTKKYKTFTRELIPLTLYCLQYSSILSIKVQRPIVIIFFKLKDCEF